LKPEAGSEARFDPSGKVLAVVLDPGEVGPRYHLFDFPSLKYRGARALPVFCLSPSAIGAMGLTNDQPPELLLSDATSGRPLLRIAHDVQARGLSFNFSPDGRYVVFGRRDGTISILDLIEINRRLSELHLGW
jgi:hypothetical protein